MSDVVEEPPPPSPSEPAEPTDAPDLPDPPETGSHEPENRPGTDVAHEPENRPGTDVATEPEVADLEGVHPAGEAATSSAGAGRQDRQAPDLPDPVDGPVQADPAQVGDAQAAQADLDAASVAAQETEESSDDTSNRDDLESDGAAPERGTATPLETDGDADEESDTRIAPLDGLDTNPGNDNSADQEDQASDSIQADGASETGEGEPPGTSLKGDGEEDSGVIGDHTDSDEAADSQDTQPAADKADPGTQTHETDEASSPHDGSLDEDENPPSLQGTATDEGVEEDGKPTKEKSLQKELVPEHHIEPAAAIEVGETRDISEPVIEEERAPAPSEPAETTGAPDLPEPQTLGDKPENHPGTEVKQEPVNSPGMAVPIEPEATGSEAAERHPEESSQSGADNARDEREAPELPDPILLPEQPGTAPAREDLSADEGTMPRPSDSAHGATGRPTTTYEGDPTEQPLQDKGEGNSGASTDHTDVTRVDLKSIDQQRASDAEISTSDEIDDHPSKEPSLHKELVPEETPHSSKPTQEEQVTLLRSSDIADTPTHGSFVAEEGPLPPPSTPAESADAPDLPVPKTVSTELDDHPGTGIAGKPSTTDSGDTDQPERHTRQRADGFGHQNVAPDLPAPAEIPTQPGSNRISDTQNKRTQIGATSNTAQELGESPAEASDQDNAEADSTALNQETGPPLGTTSDPSEDGKVHSILAEDLTEDRDPATDATAESEPSQPNDAPSDASDGSARHNDDPAEGAFMDRLKKMAGAGHREADPSERLADTVHRPDYRNPLRIPDEIPDRYGTPLDRADGTRTPLFEGPPSRAQAQQGSLRDCGMIATLGAVAAHHPDAIRACVREAEDGNYAVKLHETKFNHSHNRYEATGNEINLTVTPDLPVFDSKPNRPAYADSVRTGTAWGPILEKAVAGTDQTWDQERRGRWAELSEVRKEPTPTEGYVRLDKGSRPNDRAELLTQLTGKPAVVEDFPTQYDRNGRSPNAQLTDGIRQHLAEGKPVLVGTKSRSEAGGALPNGLEPEHVYEVTAVGDRGRFHLHNPWNRAHPAPLTLQQFKGNIRPQYSTLE